MPRSRYQKGSLSLRGKSWSARWWEDTFENGQPVRFQRREIIGTIQDYRNRKEAQRALDERLQVINASSCYKARPTASFSEFAYRWQTTILTLKKPSTQSAIKSQLKTTLIPLFGGFKMKDLNQEIAQRAVNTFGKSSKTSRNLVITLKMMWRTARNWGYVLHDPFSTLELPSLKQQTRYSFSLEEVKKILAIAPEPCKTFFWLAAETGLRAGELCGLRKEDVFLEDSVSYVQVRQSVWGGKVQEPKSKAAKRTFAISPQLADALTVQLSRCPNMQLLFATRNGTPWDANLVVKRKLHPILDGLKIPRCGLHSFRHANATMISRMGVPIPLAQARLGHSDPRITIGVYSHVVSEDDRLLAQRLGNFIVTNQDQVVN